MSGCRKIHCMCQFSITCKVGTRRSRVSARGAGIAVALLPLPCSARHKGCLSQAPAVPQRSCMCARSVLTSSALKTVCNAVNHNFSMSRECQAAWSSNVLLCQQDYWLAMHGRLVQLERHSAPCRPQGIRAGGHAQALGLLLYLRTACKAPPKLRVPKAAS